MKYLHKSEEQSVTLFTFPNFSEGDEQEIDHHIKTYDLKEFGSKKSGSSKMVSPEADSEKQDDIEERIDIKKYEEEALKLKQTILDNAEREAEALKSAAKNTGYKTGYDDGFFQGKTQAMLEHAEELKKETQHFLEQIRDFVEKMEDEKDRLIAAHMEGMKELSIAIAEKVINVSLKSSGEVIKNMLTVATEKCKNKQWAKVYISNHDEDLIVEGDMDVLEAVSNISDQVKVVIMENKPLGTCIVEFPDQIIDASVETQMGNIKQVLNT